MKKTLLLLGLLLVCNAFGQVPSINITGARTDKNQDDKNDLKELNREEKKINKNKSNKSDSDTANLKNIKEQKDKIEKKIKSDQENSISYKTNKKYYDNRITVLQAQIDKVKKDLEGTEKDENRKRIDQYNDELRLLNNKLDNLKIEKERVLDPMANNYKWLLPSKEKKYRNAFFEDTYNNSTDKTNYLNAFSIIGSPRGVTGQSEIVADVFWISRVTFGTIITASNDSLTSETTRIDALQRLINGGGNFYLDFSLPLVTTIKGNSNDIDATTYNSSVGLNLYGDISSDNRKFNFFFVANSSFYYGCTDTFYKNLEIDHKNGFLSGKLTIGLTLLNQFRFSANVLTFGSEASLRSDKITFGLQFLPNL